MAKTDLFDNLEITDDTRFILPGSNRIFVADDDDTIDTDTDDNQDAGTGITDDTTVADDTIDTVDKDTTTAEPEEEFSYEPFFQDLVNEGILFDKDGEEGYDDSLEGVRQAFKDARERDIASYIESLPPTAQRIMELARKGADEEDIQALLMLEDGPNWEEADLEDEDVQAAAVEEAMRLRDPDITDEEIQEKLEDLRDLGKLQKTAERDKKFLVKQQEVAKSSIEKQVKQREEDAKARYEQEVESVKSYVMAAESIAGYKPTKADRDGFLEYLTKKDKDGKTAAEKNNTAERRIQKEFLNYKDFNLAAVERQVTTDITKNIRKQLARYPAKGAASQPVRIEQEEGIIGRILLPGRNK